jgi:hypothetical protein
MVILWHNYTAGQIFFAPTENRGVAGQVSCPNDLNALIFSLSSTKSGGEGRGEEAI